MVIKIRTQLDSFFLFHRYPITKEFIKFCLVGFTNLALDISIYFILTRWLGVFYLLAAIFSFVVVVSWSFYLNRRWTFRHKRPDVTGQYVRFFLANCFSMILNLSIFFIAVEWWHIYDLAAKLSVAIVVAFSNFLLNKLWTFK